MNTTTYKLMGVSDEVTTCECCGRENLKRTVSLGVLDSEGNWTGDVVHFGCDCASKTLRQRNKPMYGNQNLNSKKVHELAAKAASYASAGYTGMDRLFVLEAM